MIGFRHASACVAALLSTPAFAHHLMGGAMPKTFGQGLLSGLGHPVIGVDHFAAMIGIGLVTALLGQGMKPIFLFSAALIGGVALHLAKIAIPAAEFYVAMATLAIGLFLLARKPNIWLAAGLVLLAGLIHGYALAESIVGAEQTPLAAYLFGLFVIQSALGVGAFAAARIVTGGKRDALFPFAGSAIALAGLASALAS